LGLCAWNGGEDEDKCMVHYCVKMMKMKMKLVIDEEDNGDDISVKVKREE